MLFLYTVCYKYYNLTHTLTERFLHLYSSFIYTVYNSYNGMPKNMFCQVCPSKYTKLYLYMYMESSDVKAY